MDATPQAPTSPSCPTCGGPAIKWGKDSTGVQRFRCKRCKATFATREARPLGRMLLSLDKAVLCVSLLAEGSSIRSAERISGVHRDTICRLLRVAGDKSEAVLSRLVRNLECKDIQCDELWSYVVMKEKTKTRKKITSPEIGDAYSWLAVERHSKLLLAHHVGRRTAEDANLFAAKLATAVKVDGATRPQISTDGLEHYISAFENHFGGSIDFAQLIKTYSGTGLDSERRYSPASIISTEKRAIWGEPAEEKICTSHVERVNLQVRMMSRRFTRLTTGFSKKRENLKAAVSLFAATYNLTWSHRTLKGCTPAMVAGITRKPWTVRELLTA